MSDVLFHCFQLRGRINNDVDILNIFLLMEILYIRAGPRYAEECDAQAEYKYVKN